MRATAATSTIGKGVPIRNRVAAGTSNAVARGRSP
jgi:hypothetical protein